MNPIDDVGQAMDLGNLADYWQVVDREFQEVDRLPPITAGRLLTDRAFDESQVAGHRTYIEVLRYLSVAKDNHDALLFLLKHRGATLWAPWSLLRPTFEAAFFAAWILDPDDGRERRARGLRCEIRDAYEQRNHRSEFKSLPEARKLIEEAERLADNTSMATYRAEADQLGRRFDTLRQQVNIRDELAKLSFVKDRETTGPFLRAAWRQLSGFEHGLGWAMLSGADRGIEAKIPGGVEVHLTLNDEAFVTTAKSTYFLLIFACRILRQRHHYPTSLG